MVAQKRMSFFRTDAVINPVLREQIDQLDVSDKDRREMQKDVHLLEAAMITDKTITSLNEHDRKRFASASDVIIEIQDIVWANPDKPDEHCLEWLRRGCPAEKDRQLGYDGD